MEIKLKYYYVNRGHGIMDFTKNNYCTCTCLIDKLAELNLPTYEVDARQTYNIVEHTYSRHIIPTHHSVRFCIIMRVYASADLCSHMHVQYYHNKNTHKTVYELQPDKCMSLCLCLFRLILVSNNILQSLMVAPLLYRFGPLDCSRLRSGQT